MQGEEERGVETRQGERKGGEERRIGKAGEDGWPHYLDVNDA